MFSVRRGLVACVAAGALMLAACGGGDATQSSEGQSSAAGGSVGYSDVEELISTNAEGRTVITHVYGETIIPEKVERVATVGWNAAETVLALGIVPVSMEHASWGTDDDSGMFPWVRDKIKELGGIPQLRKMDDGIEFEALAKSKPDIILATYSGITKEEYDKLSKIAPTVAYPKNEWGTPWRDQLLIDSTALNKAEEGKKQLADLDAKIAKVREEHPEFANYTIGYVDTYGLDGNNLWHYTSRDPRQELVLSLGFKTAPSLEKIDAMDVTYGIDLSLENPEFFDDIDLMVNNANPEDLANFQAHPAMGKIRAVKNGAMVMRGDFSKPMSALSVPNALSLPIALDSFVEQITQTLPKVQK